MALTIYEGRPADISRRQAREIRVYDLLDRLGIPYQRIDHEPAANMEICDEIDKTLQATICKNLFLCNRQKTAFYLLLIPSHKVFHTKDLSKQVNSSRLSFADGEDIIRYLDIEPGSVSIMGLMNDPENKVRLLVDREVREGVYFGCHPCVNTSSLKIRTDDIFNLFLPYVGHEPTFVTL